MGDSACWQTGLLSNGKVIYSAGQLVRTVALDEQDMLRLSSFVLGLPDAMVLVRGPEGDALLGASPELERTGAGFLAPGIPHARELPQGPITACTLVCSPEPARSSWIVSEVERLCPGLECLSPAPGCYDVMPRGWNKRSALDELLHIMKISVDEVVVFGDSENDVPILEAVPNSVAVANAMPAAARAARWHIGTCADDAVAQALEDIARAARTHTTPSFMAVS